MAKGQPAQAGQSPWSTTHGQGRCLRRESVEVRVMRNAQTILTVIRELCG